MIRPEEQVHTNFENPLAHFDVLAPNNSKDLYDRLNSALQQQLLNTTANHCRRSGSAEVHYVINRCWRKGCRGSMVYGLTLGKQRSPAGPTTIHVLCIRYMGGAFEVWSLGIFKQISPLVGFRSQLSRLIFNRPPWRATRANRSGRGSGLNIFQKRSIFILR